MSPGVGSPILHRLIDLIEKLGPINPRDTWLGKRRYSRVEMVLPVRMRVIGNDGKAQGPAFTARSRDVSDEGLGLTAPCNLATNQQYQVELFSNIGTFIGRMSLLHCTQTLGGYKLGLHWPHAPKGDTNRAHSPWLNKGLSMPPGKPQSDALTFKQALEEIRQAMRKYYVATISRGMLGLSMEKEIDRIIETLPIPANTDIKAEPRRKAYRHEVEGQVHLMVSTPKGHELSNNDIVDFSAGGARIVIVPPKSVETCGMPPVTLPWPNNTSVTMGIWTPTGTLWLPARIAYCDSQSPDIVYAGLRFTLDKVMKDFA